MFPKLPILLILAALMVSCSSTTGAPPPPTLDDLPSACRTYDVARGGVQITCVYYDQQTNLEKVGEYNEWIVISSDRTVNTAGWRLNAGDSTQDFLLPASITNTLTVYTRAAPTWVSTPTGSFGQTGEKWLWNNTQPDTARIIDATGQVVDEFTYKGK